MIAETEKYAKCELRAYNAEQQLASAYSKHVQLQANIDKLRMKYEPGTAVLYWHFGTFLWNFWTVCVRAFVMRWHLTLLYIFR